MSTDKDYFSKQSTDYARYRPRYPDSLFSYLASLVSTHDCAWDCATGNGQAALGLADHFENVIATDISEAQLRGAFQHPRIQYKVARAEAAGFPAESVDLITVAQALHWFNVDTFYEEVNRVAKPGGAIGVWCYELNTIEPDIDAIVRKYYDEIVGPYWPPERRFVADGYRSLPFPFREIQTPIIEMQTRWDLDRLLGYLRSWSATQRYVDSRNEDPTQHIADSLRKVWGPVEKEKTVRWPLHLRIGFRE